jgi:hypothetical protein
MEKFIDLLKKIFWRCYFLSQSASAFKEKHFLIKIAILPYFLLAVFITVGVVFIEIPRAFSTPEERAEEARLDAERAAKKQEEQQNATILEAENRRRELDRLPHVTAIQWAQKFSDNQIAANKEFLDKKFRITGKIRGFTDDDGDAMVILDRNTYTGKDYDFALPVIKFRKGNADRVILLKKGDTVSAVCIGYEPGYRGEARADKCKLIE